MRKIMTKKQEKRLNRIKALLAECKSMISVTLNETIQTDKVKKQCYIPFQDRLTTLKSETQLKKLRYYL